MNSTYDLIGVPEAVAIASVSITFFLAMVPFTAGYDFGIFKVPNFPDETKRKLRIAGPMLLALSVLMFVPIWPLRGQATSEDNVNPEITLFYHKTMAQQATTAAAGLRNAGYTVTMNVARHLDEPDDAAVYRLTIGNEFVYPPKHSDKLLEILQFFNGISLNQRIHEFSDDDSPQMKELMKDKVTIYLSGPMSEERIEKLFELSNQTHN